MVLAIVALFFALREWWIRTQDPGKTLLVPFTLAIIVSIVSVWRGLKTLHVAIVTGFTAFVATSALSMETICLSKPTSFMRANRIIAHYNTDIELNAIALVVVTGLCFIGGGVLGLFSAKIRRLICPRSIDCSGDACDN